MDTNVTENEIRDAVLKYLRTLTPPSILSLKNPLVFESKKEYTIYLGRKRCRADAALLLNKKPIVLVECKCHGQAADGIEQLKSYLCGSVAHLGIFANSANADNWTYLEKSSVVMPFLQINRVTFEEQVFIECQTGREIQEKIRVRSNHLINVEARKRATESKIRQEARRLITQAAKERATDSEIQSEVEHQLRQDIESHREAARHFKQEMFEARREHDTVKRALNAVISDLKTELRKVRRYLLTALIVFVSAIVILIIVLIVAKKNGNMVNVFKPPQTQEKIHKILHLPYQEDENLHQAVIDGIRRLKLRQKVKTHFIFITDEPGNPKQPITGTIALLKERPVTVSVIGTTDKFQQSTAYLTGGVYVKMPNAHKQNSPNQ